MTWIQTFTGRPWDLLEPKATDVVLDDLVQALAQLVRFTGHCIEPYTVAEHSVRVARIVMASHPNRPQMHLAALLHDGHEAYLGDWSHPLKMTLRELGIDGVRKRLEEAHDHAIAEWAGLPSGSTFKMEPIKHADLVMLATERRDLMGPCPREWGPLPEPLTETIKPWPHLTAAWQFEQLFMQLTDAVMSAGKERTT